MKKLAEKMLLFFRENRRLVPGFIAIVVLSLLIIVKTGYGYHRQMAEEISVKAEQLENYRSPNARSAGTEKASDKDRLASLEKRTIKADTSSTRVAYLQESFMKLAKKRGVAIESQRALASTEDGPYTKVSVEYRLAASVPQLKELLTDMSFSPVLIGVGSIRIRTQERSGRLDIDLVIEGAASGTRVKDEDGSRS